MEQIKKKILVVDDSALMRRVLSDLINSDKRFQVVAKAANGMEAFDLLSRESYDGVVLDLNMPKMNGLELLAELRKFRIAARIMIASTDSAEGAKVTLDALELGALDFIQKPGSSLDCRGEDFAESFLGILHAVTCGKLPTYDKPPVPYVAPVKRVPIKSTPQRATGTRRIKKLVAIASSTGGPKALQSILAVLPKDLDAPVVLVQHMPKGFTTSFAERLNEACELNVREAADGEELEKGTVYVAMGGRHLNVEQSINGNCVIRYSDEPLREGVKPSANYMFESLAKTEKLDLTCVVLTGMGSDGTDGIRNLKDKKEVYVITQDCESCVVYGMPKSIVNAGLSDKTLPLDAIAKAIEDRVGRLT